MSVLTKKSGAMKFSLRFLISVVLCCVLGGCGRTSRIAREDSDSFRKHTFWSDKKTVFSSTVSVLQDMRYVVRTTDYASGLITAETLTAESRKKAGGRMFVSAFVEEFPNEGTAVHLDFIADKGSGRSVKEVFIFDRGLYEEVFNKIEQKVRGRQQIQLYQLQQNRD